MFTCADNDHSHAKAEVARRCQAGETWPCHWLVELPVTEDGFTPVTECNGATWETPDGGWECEWGHSHTPDWVRAQQGWNYASDPEEARLLARAGVWPVAMDGGPIEIAP